MRGGGGGGGRYGKVFSDLRRFPAAASITRPQTSIGSQTCTTLPSRSSASCAGSVSHAP